MDREKVAKFDRLLLIERFKRWGSIVAVGSVIVGLLVWQARHDPPVEVVEVEGVAKSWTRAQTDKGSGSLVMVVELAGQQEIIVRQKITPSPNVGARVRLQKIKTTAGRIRYRWKP